MPRVRVERQPVRRVGQADRMEQRNVGKSVVEETQSLVGDGNVKTKSLMYQGTSRNRGADGLLLVANAVLTLLMPAV